ncbi:ankyrin repeat domain-containing protein [Dyadobacter sp. CY345]|uniref:ankyrin repeat domain-containing protein n=1 Tax=Dyadobacter sp. CY345 TaxID=2909335 RepID=UPI001F34F2AF|nr:ankyrin repeat domain-containing protein [Dyadobacter sp. CY345]MCF2447240.1 ankyrin repeat domain-containing protein [Dyadobacter sp. CY345]
MEDKTYREQISDDVFRTAVELLDAGNESGLENHLHQYPDLVNQYIRFDNDGYFSKPCLLNFVAENPIRNEILPKNIVELTGIILEAGAKENAEQINYTLGLVCSGRVARECRLQIPLIELFHEYGADLNNAMFSALAHGEFEAAEFLIQTGAEINLPTAAATGRYFEFQALLPGSNDKERHLAFAFAAQHGRTEILRLLLESGENPDRYNPEGAHAFSTPLHQAVTAGHGDIVKLLVEAGARLDLQDKIYGGTALDWAVYAGKSVIEKYLRSKF